MTTSLEPLLGAEPLLPVEARRLLIELVEEGEPARLAAFLTASRLRPPDVGELAGYLAALRAMGAELDLGDDPYLDIVGTGGDGRNTINISTAAALLCAAAGAPVAKHGSGAYSSAVGASDAVRSLGLPLLADEAALRASLEECNFCYLHAPHFKSRLAPVAQARRVLSFRTVFNLLGPLSHPGKPAASVVGVVGREQGELAAAMLRQTGSRFAVLVDHNGFDEISLTAPVTLLVNEGEQTLAPEDFGVEPLALAELRAPDALQERHALFLALLGGSGPEALSQVVAANAAVALTLLSGRAITHEYQNALNLLRDGAALQLVERLRRHYAKLS